MLSRYLCRYLIHIRNNIHIRNINTAIQLLSSCLIFTLCFYKILCKFAFKLWNKDFWVISLTVKKINHIINQKIRYYHWNSQTTKLSKKSVSSQNCQPSCHSCYSSSHTTLICCNWVETTLISHCSVTPGTSWKQWFTIILCFTPELQRRGSILNKYKESLFP